MSLLRSLIQQILDTPEPEKPAPRVSQAGGKQSKAAERRAEVYACIKKPMPVPAIVDATGFSYAMVYKYLGELRDEGLAMTIRRRSRGVSYLEWGMRETKPKRST